MNRQNVSQVTECECEREGWCARHRCFKNRHWFLMCQRSREWFQEWERGQGVGQRPITPTSPLRKLVDPCRHRSAEPIGEVACELCGAQNRMTPLYVCSQFEECTLFRTGGRSEQALARGACIGCQRYEASSSDVSISQNNAASGG